MTKPLMPYGSSRHAQNLSKVGDKKKTPLSLVERMPSPAIAAKVGPIGPTGALGSGAIAEAPAWRVIRYNAKAA